MSKQSTPKLYLLRDLNRETFSLKEKIDATVQRGLNSPDLAVQAECVRRARELTLELSRLTWDSLDMQMQLALELPIKAWSKPSYYYAAELRQWAKVHLLLPIPTPEDRIFIFEAITHDGQGVLTLVRTFEFLAPWQASTETEYRAMLTHLLDTMGVQWNKVPEPQQ